MEILKFNSWELIYSYLINSLNLNNKLIFIFSSWFIFFLFYYCHSWLFILISWNNLLKKYSLHLNSNFPTIEKQYEAIKEGTLDTFLIKPILLYFTFEYISEPFISFDINIPTFKKCFLDWIIMEFIFSTSLYFFHRLLHTIPYLYKNFHKKHHTFTTTISFASLYAHPVESLISTFHFYIAVILIRPHFLVYLFFLMTVTIEFVDSHCGYDVPWNIFYPWSRIYPWGSGVRFHNYHHSHNLGTYGGGLFGIWDTIFQTDTDFQKFEQKRLKTEEKMNQKVQ